MDDHVVEAPFGELLAELPWGALEDRHGAVVDRQDLADVQELDRDRSLDPLPEF